MRNHRLRERRLKLGVSQYLVGCLAGLPTGVAQNAVSKIERGLWRSYRSDAIRRALVYLELEPRRRREEKRRADAERARMDAILLDPESSDRNDAIVEYLVDLLWDGMTDEFDAFAVLVDPALVQEASDKYLDRCTPKQEALSCRK